MLDSLAWSALEPKRAREILAELLEVEDAGVFASFDVEGTIAPLPFYRDWQLVRLCSRYHDGDTEGTMEDVYALWRSSVRSLLLDGSSTPVHEANANESLQLEDSQVPDYIRWFCFAVRADDAPFTLFEQAPPKVAAKHRAAAKYAEPLTAKGRGDNGDLLYETTVIFTGTAFTAVFSVPPNGEMEMVDDDVLGDFPAELTPSIPPLGLGPKLAASLGLALGVASTPAAPVVGGSRATRRTSAKRRKRGTSSRPTIIELVQLLLERALRDQAQNRLLGYFNATLPSADALHRFAALLRRASPVVIVETNIPFVEETISDIVNDLLTPGTALPVCRGKVETDGNGQEVLTGYPLPSQGPAVVLIPLQVYRRVMQPRGSPLDTLLDIHLPIGGQCPVVFESIQDQSDRRLGSLLLRCEPLEDAPDPRRELGAGRAASIDQGRPRWGDEPPVPVVVGEAADLRSGEVNMDPRTLAFLPTISQLAFKGRSHLLELWTIDVR